MRVVRDDNPRGEELAMEAVTAFAHQMRRVNAILHNVAHDLSPDEWMARPGGGQNRLGFMLWHIPASEDWFVHTWIRNVAEVRDCEPWAASVGVNRLGLAFGIGLAEADAIAEAVDPTLCLPFNPSRYSEDRLPVVRQGSWALAPRDTCPG
jgi:hypothetical protein